MLATSWTYRYYIIVGIFNMQTDLMILCDSLKYYTLWGVTLKTRYDKIRLSVVLLIWWIDDTMGTELLMSLYKQWSVTHYTFDVIVLTSSEKSFSWLHHRIFQKEIIEEIMQTLTSWFNYTVAANLRVKRS